MLQSAARQERGATIFGYRVTDPQRYGVAELDHDGRVRSIEEKPFVPKSPYAVSKRIDEMYAELFTQSFGFEVVALRYFNVYGPRQRPDSMYAAAVPIFARRLLDNKPVTIFGDGGQTRDLINVRDVVRANLVASEHPDAAGKIFNVCTGIETRLLDLLDVM